MTTPKDERPDRVKKVDKALDVGFRVMDWIVFAIAAGFIGYFTFIILGVMEKPALMQWGGAALIGLISGWLSVKLFKILAWVGFG
ncbi:MAG: hypothetical protein HKO02_10470 [Hyphomonadaceae bacterium]|nr:hypothetical protein [Hyphomonadaceae bacterium]